MSFKLPSWLGPVASAAVGGAGVYLDEHFVNGALNTNYKAVLIGMAVAAAIAVGHLYMPQPQPSAPKV